MRICLCFQLLILCMQHGCTCMFMCVLCPQRSEEGTDSPGAGVTGGCGTLECWKPNSDPLQEQQMPLTTELSLQPLIIIFNMCDLVLNLRNVSQFPKFSCVSFYLLIKALRVSLLKWRQDSPALPPLLLQSTVRVTLPSHQSPYVHLGTWDSSHPGSLLRAVCAAVYPPTGSWCTSL